jgi:hypothetical protein
MAFHVEISGSIRHARVFNLSREDLMAKVVEPWLDDRPIEMGEREWHPRESSLKILDGPEMGTPDLSFGQGWSNAERSSQNVTHEVLRTAPAPRVPDAFMIESELPEEVTADLLGAHGGRAIQWSEARRRIDGRDPEIAAVVLVMRTPARPQPRSGS